MLIWFSLFVCFFVFGIMHLKKKHCIKQACKSPMASTSTQIASSSSSSTPTCRYDVFLSFCGKDTRKSFTDHLHYALKQKGIIVFRDDEKLERGKYVSEELLKAISESMYAIVVISANYASSRWCLIELAKIIQCMKDTELTVLPIFYHVDPSNVRNQTETFAKAFAKHEASLRKKNPKFDIDTMQKWRAALGEVGNISGWHVHDRHESKVVKEISRRILSGLCRNFSNVSKFLVGIEFRVEEIMSLLSKGGDNVHFLGIYGMGGIGKTTLSKVIYERVSQQFEASCFIADIREKTKTLGLVYLQKQLISEILNEREINIWNEYGTSRIIANRVRNKKVFIVLDNVDAEEQLEALAESYDWFGEGSRIIITSRDCHLLKKLFDNTEIVKQRSSFNTFEVKLLNDAEALRLFSCKAFKKPHPEENYVKLSKDIVNYAQGLPLALEVFGSSLFGRTMDAWKSARDLLKTNPNAKILDKLKISFDGLEDLEKELFLDIACFFNGEYVESIIHKLESFGYYPKFTIEVLVDKSLLSISRERFWMHDLLRKMGQKIVRDKSEEPGGRSRLWHYKDVLHVLKNNIGTDAVKGIVLELPLNKQERLNVEAFSKMKKLKMLDLLPTFFNLRTPEWHGDPSNFMLSNELCVMKWCGYPFDSLPTSFQSDNLVELTMRCSCIKQLWDGWKSFEKLKWIDLSHSQNLIETPDFSGVPNLESLTLMHCTSLSKVHPSIGFLRRLKWLYLRGCKRLRRLSDVIRLESLETLCLSDCSRFNKFPDIVGNMTSLEYLQLDGTAIKKLPFKSLSSLIFLNISGCSRLEEIPCSIVFLKKLSTLFAGGRKLALGSGSDPISLFIPNSFSGLSSLRKLDLSYRNLSDGAMPSDLSCLSSVLDSLNLSGKKFTRIPDSVGQLSNLRSLSLAYCNLLGGAIPNYICCLSSLRYLDLSGNKFTRIPDSVAQLSHLERLSLAYCSRLELCSNPDNSLFPNSFSCLSSLEKLDLSYCDLLDGAIPNDLSCLSSLTHLRLIGNKFTRIPDSVGQLSHLEHLSLAYCNRLQLSSNPENSLFPNSFSCLSSLHTLDLSYCDLLDGTIPNDLSCLSSLKELILRGNKFTRMPDSVVQLSHLGTLDLEDCRWLQVLPKLPLGLEKLRVNNCLSLEMFSKQMEMWNSNEKVRSADCSFVAAYIDYDGKPYKILHMHPQSPLWTSKCSQSFDSMIVCGPALLGSGIPEWFNDKNSVNSSGTIQMHTDLGLRYNDSDEWKGYALFIVYQVHEPDTYPRKRRKLEVHEDENSNSRIFDGSNPNLPYFVCQFQKNEVDATRPLVLRAPGVPSVGPNAFWVYLPAWWLRVWEWNWDSITKASITAGSNLNVEAVECGARVVRKDDASEFYQVVNSISPRCLDLETHENFFSYLQNAKCGVNVDGQAGSTGSLPDWLNDMVELIVRNVNIGRDA